MAATERLAELLTAARLPVPPLPAGLAGTLVEVSPWCFTTRALPWSPYCFFEYVEELDTAPDYALVAHDGHGVASYALSVYIVWEGLACLVQVAWGGVYTDPSHAAGCLEALGRLLRGVEGLHAAGVLRRSRRLMVVASDLYGSLPVTCGPGLATANLQIGPNGGDVPAVLAEAVAWVGCQHPGGKAG